MASSSSSSSTHHHTKGGKSSQGRPSPKVPSLPSSSSPTSSEEADQPIPQQQQQEGEKGEEAGEQTQRQPSSQVIYTLQSHPGLQKVMRILINGRNSLIQRGRSSGGHIFWEHNGLVQKMAGASEKSDYVMFFAILRTYLEKAALTIPQAGRIDEVDTLVNQVEDLSYQTTTPFPVVARYILRIRNMPD